MTGGLPSFVRDLDDRQLVWLTDPGSFERGVAYHRKGRVLNLQDRGQQITGKVVGSGAIYDTVIEKLPGGGVGFVDDCSCPIGGGCKHVVALVLAARAVSDDTSPAKSGCSRAGWELSLDRALGDLQVAAAGGAHRGTALLIRMSPNSYGGPASVSLTPLAEGVKGGWVKTGMGWSEIDYTPLAQRRGATPGLHPRQLAVLRAIGRAGQSPSGGYYGYRNNSVTLGDLGAAWATHLREALDAGVSLIDDVRGTGRPVRILDGAYALTATVTAPGDRQVAHVAFVVDLPALDDSEWHDVANSTHDVVGWAAATPDGLVLAPAVTPLDLPRRQLRSLGALEIPAADWARFALTKLPAIRRLAVTDAPEQADIDPPRLCIDVDHHEGHRSDVAIGFAYSLAGSEPVVVTAADDGQLIRDRAAEAALVTRFAERLALPALWRHPGEPAASASFVGLGVADLVAVLADLADEPDVLLRVQGEPAPYAEAAEPPTIAVSATGAGAGVNDWFDLTVVVTVAGEDVPLADLIAALATGQDRMLLASGTWFSLDRPELHQLASALAEARMLQDKESTGLRITPLHAGLWEQLVELGVVAEQSAAWTARVAALTDLTARESIEPPVGLDATLRDYQVGGYRWLSSLWDAGLGGVLADDMGLGKTLQVLAAIQRAKERGDLADPVLIVCPTSVIATWLHEAARFVPGLDVRALDTTRRKAGVSLDEAVAGADVVVTSFALLRIDVEAWESRAWSALVLDEAQFVKNHQSKGYQAARRVPAARTFALTGTPLENSLMDLWSLLSLAAPGLYPRPDRFKEHYAVPIEKQGAVEELAALRRRIRPLMVRRTKEAVAAELPPKQETVLHVPLATKHRAIYDRHLQRERQRLLGLVDDFNGNRFAILKALTTLRQMSLDPGLVDASYAGLANPAKIDLLVEQLHELAAEGHRALVFSQFTGFLRQVRDRLDAEGLGHCYLDGRTRKREAAVQRFRDGDQVAFLISLKAGGFGLTLTEADYVYVLDPWWNPAAEMQAVDRTHRIGQDKQVFVYRLVSAETIEEKVVALQQRKRDLFSRVVEDEAGVPSSITADDIRALLAP